MNNKERLENMSPIGFDLNGNVLLKSEDYHWLLEQAERAEKNAQDLEDMDRQLYSEQQQNKSYRKVINNIMEKQ